MTKVLIVKAYLRKYQVVYAIKNGIEIRKAIPVSNYLIGEYDCLSKALTKTQRLIKIDFDKGIVQDVWFATELNSR